MALSINRFLVGKQKFANATESKQSTLLGQLALVATGICVIYSVVDPINGLYSFLHWYVIGIVVSIAVVFINRAGHYLFSASVLMLVSIAILFIIAWIGNPNRGVYFYFLASSITSLVFFYNRRMLLAILFILINIAVALFAYLVESPIHEAVPASETAIQIRYSMNFVISVATAVIVVLFMIKRNSESESSLIESNKQLEEASSALVKSTTRFERAVTATDAGIYEWNIVSDTITATPRWRQLLGISEDETINFNYFMNLVHPEDAERTGKGMENVLKVGGTYQNELRMISSKGKYRWFLDSGIVELKEGKPFLAVGSIIDIDDRKNAESELVNKNRELQKANDELDRFVYSASHDMRAPLSTLLGLIEVVKMSEDPKEYDRYFEMMTSRIHDMEGFISEVTDYSRNTRLAVNIIPVNVYELVEKIEESFFTLAKQSGVALKHEIDKNLILKTDETRLKVVLNNLISNAIKYNNSEGERYVKVKASKSGSLCQIEIEDNGRGIDKEFQPKIFDMFFRATEESSGSGLGLYIVKETLDKLEGEISFISESRKGTTFTVSIPQGS